MDKRPSIIGEMFDRIAPTYDRLNTILSFSIDRVWRRATVQSLGIRPGDRVLDVATGTGDLALRAISMGGSVVGIDLSAQMLTRARIKLHQQCSVNAYMPVQGDALSMPFRSGTFKSAMVAFGIRNMENLEAFLDEIYRVLHTQGRFSILEFSVPERAPFKWIYMAYLKYMLPAIGGLISGDHDAYRYLRDSVMGFPAPAILDKIMEERGFRVVQSRSLLGGISHLYLVEKCQ
jgi:demethylmenaquinone methyltransferase/2-methoxy-6-polyprenyl-1,4-benzoquinol methylase